MIKFSWKKINDKLGWNPTSVLEYFFLKQEKFPPCYLSRKVPKSVVEFAKKPYPSGPCYIRNIDKVLEEAQNPNELYQYLELASKRGVFDYYVRGNITLPIALIEEYHIQWVELNPLLKIENNKIHFKYEEQEKQ